MGTITTYGHCLVKDGIAYEGTKADIVNSICKWRFDEHNNLYIKFHYYKERQHYGYGKDSEFTFEEMYRDSIEYIFKEAIQHGYRHYRDLNF